MQLGGRTMAPSCLTYLTVSALLYVSVTAADSPMSKVIKLIEDMKSGIEKDGKAYAASYAKFACFCKKNDKTKGKAIVKEEDKVGVTTADIKDTNGDKVEKETEVKNRQKNQEQLAGDLTDTVARCSKANAEFEADTADVSKAISSLEKAEKQMQARKPKKGAASSLIQYTLSVADAMNLVAEPHRQAVSSFLQVDPSDPAYKYHSKAINEILAKLLKDFMDEKDSRVAKWKKTAAACASEKSALAKKMKDNMDAMTKAGEKIQGLKKMLAKEKSQLVETEDDLKGDSKYLKTLTGQCESRAVEFDRRANIQNEVVKALTQVLAFLTGKKSQKAAGVVYKKKGAALIAQNVDVDEDAEDEVPSFLQVAPARVVTNFLAKSRATGSEQLMMAQVLSVLRAEADKTGSSVLAVMAMRVAGEHFKKVKQLVQGLIVRLQDEAKAETSKKSFCTTEVAKCEKDRDHATQKAKSMSADLAQLESAKEELEAEMKELAKGIRKTKKAMAEATKNRNREHKENVEKISTTKEGLEALEEAKAFYLKAAKVQSTVLLQKPLPTNEWEAKQGKMKSLGKGGSAIAALLDKVSGEFEQLVTETEKADADGHAEFTKFARRSREDIASKETKTKLDKQDLKNTETSIQKTLDDLKTQMSLVSDALKMIASLKPVCLDAGGMNYQERVVKRNDEIGALKTALKAITKNDTR